MISLSSLESVARAAWSGGKQNQPPFREAASPSTVLSLIACIRDLQAHNPGISFEQEYRITD